MQDYSVISKGAYVRPQTENFVAVTSFLFIRQEGKKYLLLKLKNSRAERVDEVNLKVTLLDKRGQTIRVLHLSSDKCGTGSFAFGEKIEVDDGCCDFIAKVESAVYGGYLYRDGRGGVAIDYEAQGADFDVNTVKAAMRGKTRTVKEKSLGIPVAVSVLALVFLVCAAVFTYLQLKSFMDKATGFTYSGVEYVFTDPDKAEGSEIIVTGYRGTKSNVVIPQTIGGYVVSEIREGAFEGNTKIKRLKIEGEIKIGDSAFARCTNLQSVTMDGVTKLGESSFADCKSLKSVEISGGDEIALGYYAFENCASLETVRIQTKIIYPEFAAVFAGENRISELYLQNYSTQENGDMSALFGGATPAYLSDLTIVYLDEICDNFCYRFSLLEKVTISYIEGESFSIGNSAFRATRLATLKIPQGLKAIGDFAFEGACFTSFNAYGVESIGEYAFRTCNSLTTFTIPDTLTVIKCGAFSSCANLEKITFESDETLTSIDQYAFYDCRSLTGIEIPDSVKSIGWEIFYGCENLTSLTIPFIGENAENNSTVYFLFGNTHNSLKNLTLTSAKAVAAYAFKSCAALEEVNLNEGIENLGYAAFYGCVRLKSVVVPSTVTWTDDNVFEYCVRLYEIYNLSRTEIDCEYALAIYTSLDDSIPKAEEDGYEVAYTDGSYARPEGWYLIGYPEGEVLTLPDFDGVSEYCVTDCLFYGEKEINSVTLSDSVCGIGAAAFYDCGALENLSLPQTAPVEEIGDWAFYGCYSLVSIEFPVALTSVGEKAFYYCLSLAGVRLYGKVDEIGSYAFYGCSAMKEAYIFGNSVSLGEYCFYGCTALTSVQIGGVKSVGEGAFYFDTALESVSISKAEGSIEGYAFYGCAALSEMVIPDGTLQVGVYAFGNCTNLAKVTLPNSLEKIDDMAFSDCAKLRAVVNFSRFDISDGTACGGVGANAVFVATTLAEAAMLYYTESDGVTYLNFYNKIAAVWCGETVTEINLSKLYGYSEAIVAPRAFSGNHSIKSADLSGVSKVGENAFYSCSALTNVITNASLKEVGESAFAYCISLNSINLEDSGLTYLGASAFFNCMKLTYVALPRTLGEINEQTFYYCTSLADAVIPASVTNIGTDAFFGCTALLRVHNLSRISMTAGKTNNGYCAFYALYVFTDENSVMTFAEKDGFKFANYNQSWYLYAFTYYSNVALPEDFTYGNTTVTKYKIRDGAFTSSYAAYLIIPESVTEIENNALNAYQTVYYCGNAAGWTAIRPASLISASVYYYSPCIHTDGGNLWTYIYGRPSLNQTELNWTETKPATCTENGEQKGTCRVCGYEDVRTTEKLRHYIGDDGECVLCGAHGEYVQSTDGTFDGYKISSSNFAFKDGFFTSTNTSGGTSATITITATADMQIFFGCSVSSYYDELSVTAGGETVAWVTSTYTSEYSAELLKGQSLTFSFYRSPYTYVSGKAMISYILIFA